ncbi:spermatogenesis-associated protein 46 [Larus michahellis]|uniref:spermatogenesis-associated protein 46 n=1 Tax=Larus michahellis TaxID=119627 RepID=UPI003D9B83A4
MKSFVLPTISTGATPRGTRKRSPEAPCPWASLPASPGSELPACTIYRPWFSPYSYFMCTDGATQQHLGSLSSSLAASTQEPEEPDDLSEIICSSSGSSDKMQPPERDRPASDRASITVRDILTASPRQLVPQCGYQCISCCRVFPTLWSLKIHIQHSSQEGYSCKVYYRRLKALWEKEHKEQEAASSQGTCVAPPAGQLPQEGTAPSLLPAAK